MTHPRQLAAIIECSEDAIIAKTPSGVITTWNKAAERMYGYTADEIVGQPVSSLLAPGEPSELPEILERIERGEQIDHYETTRQRKDGSLVEVSLSISPVKNESGEIVGAAAIARDINASNRRTHEAFTERQKQLEGIVASAMDAIITIEENQSIVLFNGAAERMFGCTAEEAIGSPIERFIPPRFRAGHREHVHRFGATNVTRRAMGNLGAIFGLRAGGQEFPIEASISQAEIEGRKFYTVILRDITDRKQAEDRFRLAVESAPNAMVMVDTTGQIVMVNSQTEQLFGYTREELIGARVERLVPERFREHHPAYRERFASAPQTRAMGAGRDLYGLRKDGTEVPIEIGLNPIESDGQMFVLSSIVDITGRKRAEAEREALLARERGARAEAEEANRIKDEFLATVSHELRTPLMSILGWARLCSDSYPVSGEIGTALDTIARNAKQQAQLIDDLLDVSRILSGNLRLNFRRADLRAIVMAAVDAIRPTADIKGVRLQAMLDPGAGAISGDPDRLQQVAWNLLSNAVKFTERGGRVEVGLQRAGTHVQITVIDTGKGIRPEFLPYVFERFRQADGSTTRVHGGLGLGLSIVRHLVELHGGSVHVHSAGEGRGATFTVTLPELSVDGPAADSRFGSATDGAASAVASGTVLHGIKVLVVEDDGDARVLLNAILSSQGAAVRAAASVNEAVQLIGDEWPDVIVSDIGMPGEDGYSLIRRVKSEEKLGDAVRAIALTAHARSDDRTRALAAGFDMHVTKPIEPRELVSVVAHVVGRGATQPPQ